MAEKAVEVNPTFGTEVKPADQPTEQYKRIGQWDIIPGSVKSRHLEQVEGWKTPTMLNSWINYGRDGADYIYAPAGYMKDLMGFVHLRGLIKGGTPGTTSVAFVLPKGYRPDYRLIFTPWSVLGASSTRVDVSVGGNVVIDFSSALAVSLEGIIFKAEQ
jgi:hypothetical protein